MKTFELDLQANVISQLPTQLSDTNFLEAYPRQLSMRSMHAGFHLIPLHFSYVVVYHCMSSFCLNFGPVFENRESSSSWVGVYYFLRRDSHTLSPECGKTIFFFFFFVNA